MHLLANLNPTTGDNSHLVNRVHHAEFFELCAGVADASVDMVLADLPYGTTACSWDSIIPIEPMWEQFKRIIKPRGAIVLTASQPFTSALVMSWTDGFRHSWIWNKKLGSNYGTVNHQPFKIHEDVLIFGKQSVNYYPILAKGDPYLKIVNTTKRDQVLPSLNKGAVIVNDGVRSPVTILEFSNADQTNKTHPTQKPVALFEYLIRTYTQPGDLVFDPTVGSGTTAMAARNTGRNFIAGDFTLEYVEIARRRLQGLPGKQPEPGVPRTIHMFAEYDPDADAS